ncbi:MAG: GGDEF domain-containing protein [Xanthomonadales bacterium]|nr:GGDEF domain-containing protein [Xanthomonadales bacterium]
MTVAPGRNKLFWVECIALFAVGAGTLALTAEPHKVFGDPGTAVWLYVISLLSISVGFANPYFGHASFDRLGQAAAILILGPWPAAVIGGLASLSYPLHRLARGTPLPEVIQSCLHNSGLMALVIFFGASLYQGLGGDVPLTGLTASGLLDLLILAVVMQVLNDLGMALTIWIRGGDPTKGFNWFLWSVEFGSFGLGILVALSYARFQALEFAFVLVMIGTAMLTIRRFAELRIDLERLVDERTRQLREKADELDALSKTDSLTGIWNRRYIDERLQAEMHRVQRYHRPLSIALGDIDHFKAINDRFSHGAGDQVLQRMARVMETQLRETDYVARFGGEEFLLGFPETFADDAAELCNRIRDLVAEERFEGLPHDCRVTISFGVVQAEDETPQSLVNRADEALYEAKQAGRNRVVVRDELTPSGLG